MTTEWGYHTARVNTIAWTPDSKHLATGALDTQIIIWSPDSKTKYTVIKGNLAFFDSHCCYSIHARCRGVKETNFKPKLVIPEVRIKHFFAIGTKY